MTLSILFEREKDAPVRVFVLTGINKGKGRGTNLRDRNRGRESLLKTRV
jgi:hypothetical protein